MLELMREAVAITIAGLGGGAITIAVGFGVESIVAWI